jgi:signal transduction histidine kinase
VGHARPPWAPNETPNDLGMLAHELRRRVAALRVADEAIATLRGQGLDTAHMLDLLMGEIDDLDELAREVLQEGHGDRADAADPGPEGSGEPQGGAPVGRGRGSDRGPEGLPTASGVRAGHGIGLFLVRRFLDAAGGRSWLAERQGGGTVVGLSLPLRQGHALEDAVNT